MKNFLHHSLAGIFALSLMGCSSSSSNLTSFTNTTAVGQSAKVDGFWHSTLPGTGNSIEFLLVQNGHKVQGEGVILRDGMPDAIAVRGAVRPDGVAMLNLLPQDLENDFDSATLAIRFEGNEAEASLDQPVAPEHVDFRLTRGTPSLRPRGDSAVLGKIWDNGFAPLSTIRPSELYQVNASSVRDGLEYHIDVELMGTTLWEFIGSWKLTSGEPLWIGTEGRVSAGCTVAGDWARITFKDKYGIGNYGSVWFRRHTDGRAGTSREISKDDSRINSGKKFRNVTGNVILVQP